ncbi:virion core protein (lumpy skin disease virus) [Tumebacillus algifaecis]|uniref:Virion core protein (Lumpy skin disease virus) n=1 Tax=Tumebacillus algifaecis TaxID=1214604 RepID=A0A223D5E4_9BACL|nr:SPFH domain-containing protein [Tumebacillus algifaecis]ASS76584.1 virion core protein (lumpy skin disease virus) [Tumebacillus algifaecis]
MGLIKAGLGAVGGVLADQWKEFFYCDSLDADILVAKGQKRTSKRSSNTKGEDNIITNGSVIAVNDGQCMIIVEQGKVVEFCAEPGEFTWDASTEPSIFSGNLKESIRQTFQTIGKRFTFGGDTGKDQRIYFFNTKEIVGNKYGTANPVPFRVVDRNIGLDIDISIRCNGEYSYKIVDPMLFYTNVSGNVDDVYNRANIDSMLKSELLTALQPAFAKISDMGIRYSSLPGHTLALADALNEVLSKKWAETRGLAIASFGVNSVTASKEDEDMIKQLQKSAIMRDPNMAAATLVGAQADAMKAAASNEGGAMAGFMGFGMAQQAGGMNAQSLFAMGQAQQQAQQQQASQPVQQAGSSAASWTCTCGALNTGKFCAECGKTKPVADGWNCSCGAVNTGKFCAECGKTKPEADGWSCSCGTVNKGKFCAECGSQKPAGELSYQCDKCGWLPENPAQPPKFCPECGDLFDDNDKK